MYTSYTMDTSVTDGYIVVFGVWTLITDVFFGSILTKNRSRRLLPKSAAIYFYLVAIYFYLVILT